MSSLFKCLVALVLTGATSVAIAHSDAGSIGGGFISGFTHPLFGPDHVIAMVAVGLWGVFLGKPAIWLLPIVFPLVMAFGGALGVAGVPVPAVEVGIALSGLVLGLMVAFAVKAPIWVAVSLAFLPSSMVTRTVPSYRKPPARWPTAWASSSRLVCCISSVSCLVS